jgi:hypothetical protein
MRSLVGEYYRYFTASKAIDSLLNDSPWAKVKKAGKRMRSHVREYWYRYFTVSNAIDSLLNGSPWAKER